MCFWLDGFRKEKMTMWVRFDYLNNYLKSTRCPHFLCFYDLNFVVVLCSSPSPSGNRSCIVHWFKKTDHPHRHNKQTNTRTAWLEEAVRPQWGGTGVVFDDNAWSLCSLCHWALCFHFSSAQLSAHTHSIARAPVRAHTHNIRGTGWWACLYTVITNCDGTYDIIVQ